MRGSFDEGLLFCWITGVQFIHQCWVSVWYVELCSCAVRNAYIPQSRTISWRLVYKVTKSDPRSCILDVIIKLLTRAKRRRTTKQESHSFQYNHVCILTHYT